MDLNKIISSTITKIILFLIITFNTIVSIVSLTHFVKAEHFTSRCNAFNCTGKGRAGNMRGDQCIYFGHLDGNNVLQCPKGGSPLDPVFSDQCIIGKNDC
jgi:hypothetical protein